MKILVIEDDKIWQLRIEMLLEKLGYNDVVIADNINQAHVILFDEKPQLIIADIHLHQGKVFPLFKYNKNSLIPTIFVSAIATPRYIDKIRQIPNAIYLEKPFGELALNVAIDNLIQKSHPLTLLNDSSFNAASTKVIFQTIKDIKLLELLNFNETDKKILNEKWFELKSFKDIGQGMGIAGERVRHKYDQAIKKLKTKIQRVAINLNEYNEFKKVRYNSQNLKKIKKDEKQFLEIDTLNIHIDELIEIPTKYRNVLKERDLTRLGDLTHVTYKQLSMTKHLGSGSATMIQNAIAKFGLKLKE